MWVYSAMEENEFKKIIILSSSVVISHCYCYFLVSKIPCGKFRFISLIPIFSLFTILPLSLSYALTITTFTLFITWLSNLKLLLFAFDQGPLSPPHRSLIHFITIASFPIKIRQQGDHGPTRPKALPLNLGTHVLCFAILMPLVYDYKDRLHPMILLVLYNGLLSLLLEILISVFNSMVGMFLGLDLEPPSNEPYLSTSLQDFWGRRWNLMVTDMLRQGVYKPVRLFSTPLLGKNWAPLPSVLATFLVSSLMHELLIYYIRRATPTWEMTSYFALHGMCVVVEFGAKKALAGKWELPRLVAITLTVGFVMTTSSLLFLKSLVESGIDVRVLEEYMQTLDFVKGKLKF